VNGDAGRHRGRIARRDEEDVGRLVLPAAADLALEPQTCVRASRRQFIGAAFAAAPPLLTGAGVGYSALTLNEFRINRLTVPLADLPRDLDGLTIAYVSDTHVGRFVDSEQLGRIIDASNALRADLTLFTGDLINSAIADLPSALDGVRKLDGRFGVYCIEGNHDLFDDPFEFERRVKSAGVPLLLDESTVLSVRGVPLELLGLRWGLGGGGRPGAGGDDALALSVPRLLQNRRPDALPILLAHHPHAFAWAAEAQIPLTLSGHTHGGQLMLTNRIGFGRVYRYWSGLYTRGTSSLIVSNGVGHWFPLRLNAPAEIVHVTLRRA
jgi:predicted MPP superfamily phosphohydrolase